MYPNDWQGFILNSSENSGWEKIPFALGVDVVGVSMGGVLVTLSVQSVLCCHCKDRRGECGNQAQRAEALRSLTMS